MDRPLLERVIVDFYVLILRKKIYQKYFNNYDQHIFLSQLTCYLNLCRRLNPLIATGKKGAKLIYQIDSSNVVSKNL